MRLPSFSPTLVAFAAFAAFQLSPESASAADWPQFRGPDRSDHSPDKGLLKEWPEGGPKRLWLYEDAGIGYSGPAIVGGTLYTMGARDGKEMVIALDAKSGKEKWSAEVSGSVYENNWGDGPRATPTVSNGGVFAMGARGDLVALRADNGEKIWSVSMTEDLGGSVPGWGYCESVLVDGDQVICTPGGKEGAIAALDRKSGEVLWRSKGLEDGAQYSSVIAADHAGKRQYIQLFMGTLAGVDAKSGELLWRSDWGGKTAVIPTPIYTDGKVYISSGYGVGCKLVELSGGNEVSDVWQNKVMTNHHGGVILAGDHLYGYSDGGGLVCQDLKSGEEVWGERGEVKKGAIHYADGMLYFIEEDRANVILAEATPAGYKERGRFKLDPQTKLRKPSGRIWTHPVVLDGKLYLRDQDLIYCYDVNG
ncbi:MAG: PQQ-binding-like beta-propeller repeat protein [Verrucomicrobiales bacterium]